MTVVILDRFPGPLPPYADWLGDTGADLVLVTGRTDFVSTEGYAAVRMVPGFAGAAGELSVLALAETTQLAAIVATAGEDLVRAGALRDLLGLPGQSRADALLFADPVAMRERLARHDVPAVPCGPVHRVSDLYWYAHRWGYPVRVRERRPPWPTTVVLWDEADLRAYTDGGLVSDLQSIPDLFAEPMLGTARPRPDLLSVVDGVVAGAHEVSGMDTGLVDTVACHVDPAAAPDVHRAVARAQAGLDREVVRWAS
jgi:hypothetical protein